MILTKEQVQRLKDTLYASKDEAFGLALATMMMYEVDRVKDAIVTAEPGDVSKLQGEALSYLRILKYLKERTTIPVKSV